MLEFETLLDLSKTKSIKTILGMRAGEVGWGPGWRENDLLTFTEASAAVRSQHT